MGGKQRQTYIPCILVHPPPPAAVEFKIINQFKYRILLKLVDNFYQTITVTFI